MVFDRFNRHFFTTTRAFMKRVFPNALETWIKCPSRCGEYGYALVENWHQQ